MLAANYYCVRTYQYTPISLVHDVYTVYSLKSLRRASAFVRERLYRMSKLSFLQQGRKLRRDSVTSFADGVVRASCGDMIYHIMRCSMIVPRSAKDDGWSSTMLGAIEISPSSLATACSASLDDFPREYGAVGDSLNLRMYRFLTR